MLACWLTLGGCREAARTGAAGGDGTKQNEHSSSTPAAPTASGATSSAASTSDAATTRASASDTADGAPTAWPADRYAAAAPGARISSMVRHLWIRPSVHHRGGWLGYLSLGDSVRVKGGDARLAQAGRGPGGGCEEWYEIEPRGFVCTGAEASLDANDPRVRELERTKAKSTSPWPYRYGESLGTPVYASPPTPEEQALREPGLVRWRERVLRAAQLSDDERRTALPELGGVALGPAAGPAPQLVELGPLGRSLAGKVIIGSTLAYAGELDVAGRPFLVTWDRAFVPKDRVRPYAESPFRGVVLGSGVELPLAFFRREGGGARYERDGAGAVIVRGPAWERLAWVALTGKTETHGGARYLETKDGAYCRERDVAVAARAASLPPKIALAKTGRRSWLDLRIEAGTLVAYEHERPVYATLISPGRGGAPLPGIPPLDTASTPTGVFEVLGKFVTATMTSSTVSTLVHAEVQYTQNFDGPYALHGAYWHDRWGEKKSAGCVNLAPIDALRLFAWTDPPVPEGWHGLASRAVASARTVLWLQK